MHIQSVYRLGLLYESLDEFLRRDYLNTDYILGIYTYMIYLQLCVINMLIHA